MKTSTTRISRLLLSVLLLLPVLSLVGAEEKKDKPLLSAADITRFIETLPAIQKDFEQMGHSISSHEDMTSLKDFQITRQVGDMLKKHGWEPEKFFVKVNTIIMGYTGINIEQQLEAMPAQHRAMAESMMRAQMPDMTVHPEDRKLLAGNLQKLTRFFETME